MLHLYHSPTLCSMASRIALEEVGADHEVHVVNVLKGEHKQPDYLAINPRGQVPYLIGPEVRLNETVAILLYLARQYPDFGLISEDPAELSRAINLNAWFASAVHPTFARLVRPDFATSDEAAFPAIRAKAREDYWDKLGQIDTLLEKGPWLLGADYSISDIHALVYYGWGLKAGLPVHDLHRLAQWRDRMVDRPAVRRALEADQSEIIAA